MNRLFNCCPGGREPDWTRYTRLEMSGSVNHDGETETMVSARDAAFFTVYGRFESGECEAITDCHNTVSLLEVMAALEYVSALSVHMHPSLDERRP